LNANLWFNIGIALPNVFKKPGTKSDSISPEGNSQLGISDLFSFALDVTFAFSADNPATLKEDVVSSLSPILAVSLFLLLLKIEFSFMFLGSVTFTLLLAKFSGNMLADWIIKMAALLVYFRKGGGGAAFYLTYSRGEASNDMATLAGPLPNKPAANAAAKELYKNMGKDKVKDCLKSGGTDASASMIPTGFQVQVYDIITWCTGTIPKTN